MKEEVVDVAGASALSPCQPMHQRYSWPPLLVKTLLREGANIFPLSHEPYFSSVITGLLFPSEWIEFHGRSANLVLGCSLDL